MLNKDVEHFIVKFFGLVDTTGYEAKNLAGGLSGAEVYLLEIKKPRRSRNRGTYIMKLIDTKGRWYNEANNEADRTREIFNESPEFQEHLVELVKSEKVQDSLVLILTYANHSTMGTVPFKQIRLDKKFPLLKDISYQLLAGLNKERIEVVEDKDMVGNLCQYRLDEGGNLKKRVRNLLRESNRPGFVMNGVILPNPSYYVPKIIDAFGEKPLYFIKGITHGDLHLGNIFVTDDEKKYVIIDYDSCATNYLMFDQAYLELSVYTDIAENWDMEKWLEGLKSVFNFNYEEQESAEFAGFIRVRKSIWAGVEVWYKEQGLNIYGSEAGDSFQLQMALARIAAGINYFSKAAVTEQNAQIRYLAYVGYALQSLFSQIHYEWNNSNVSILNNTEGESACAERLWEECGKFRAEYIKVLVTDDDYAEEQYSGLADISCIEWRFIVDVSGKKPSASLCAAVTSAIMEASSIKNISESEESICFNKGQTIYLSSPEEGVGNFAHWRKLRNKLIPVIKKLRANESFKPFLFVIDIKKKLYVTACSNHFWKRV